MSLGTTWTLVSDVCYDDSGNLWALNGYTLKPLNVMDNNGVWYNYDVGTAARNKFTKKMIVDFDGNIWFATSSDGMFGYSTNNSLADPSDDAYINLRTGVFSGDLPSQNVTALAADFDGEIWIGTDAGFAILYNANSAFTAVAGEFDAQRIKVEFEGNVEYLLGNTHITDIEVDGGNRKWMATASAGILLLSQDGSEILEQHTTKNSPLISDNILDLKLDQTTGELFIITDKGLVSYRTNATYEDPEYATTKVFPNPVRPNYAGVVTIQGIRYNSDVKVTDIAGNLVYKTTSNGGTATWDVKTLGGDAVASGVYIIWTATNEGKDEKVGKVLVIR
jgi:ligand-binding sensor domain-containing protein